MRSWTVVMILVLLLGSQCHGCWEDERIALLQIKSAFNHPYDQSMSRWGIDADCCGWERVWCDKTTQRVTEIDLGSIIYSGSGGWYLNASLFLPFIDLKTLRLAKNQILGCTENEGFEKLSRLAHLEFLYLGGNEFNESIMTSLRSLSSLKILDLSDNRLKGILHIQGDDEEVLRLSNLEFLDLSNNSLDNSILSSLKGLPSLERLNLGYNRIKGSINVKETKSWSNITALALQGIRTNASHELELQSLPGSFPNLETLYLSSNNLRGASFGQGSHHLNNLKHLDLDSSYVDENFLQGLGALVSLQHLSMEGLNGAKLTRGLCELNQLQGLDISRNDLSGTLLPCMANLTSLRDLNLFDNQFTGSISLSPLRSLTSLEFLILSHNQFQIPVTLSPFFNHTKLFAFIAEGNNIFSEAEQHSLAPKFQLTALILSGYGYSGKFPKFLYYQHELQFVHLSDIQMSGGFPYWLLENNRDLFSLSLVNSSLSGPLQLPRHSLMNLSSLDISENCLRGHVPAQIGALLPRVVYLNMSRNSFSGGIPPSLGNMSSIEILDLSNNQLSGEVPGQLATSCLMLRMLVLSNNSLQGQIFPMNWQLGNLLALFMSSNHFTGTIPESLSNSSFLTVLDLSHNNLQELPRWIGNMSSLLVLDLSGNNISGSLPSNFPSSLVQVYLSKNRLQGSLESAFFNSSNLMALDLSRNYFTGSIPQWIDTFSNLSYLLLANNNFEGEIPIQLCKLDKLHFIDFSHNFLSGHILPCLRSGSIWNSTHISESIRVNYSSTVNSAFQPHAEFTTKRFSYSYKGRLLSYMSGIDLSCNNLMGEIPPEFGNLSTIKVLNLSHNNLTGPIPSTFSNIKEIESLDLSYNNLDGKIPPQLTQLYQLAVFTVAHNNLSGKTPEMVAQFSTFDNRSYEDNPFLCGPPLTKSCNGHPSLLNNSGKHEEETGLINMDAFYPSFLASYSMVLLGMATVLYINPHWRKAWFYFVEECINNCYYFIVGNLPMLSKYRASQPCI